MAGPVNITDVRAREKAAREQMEASREEYLEGRKHWEELRSERRELEALLGLVDQEGGLE